MSIIDNISDVIKNSKPAFPINIDNLFTSFVSFNLKEASKDIAENGRTIGIVTGFYIPQANPPASETDGPPGALVLAKGFIDMGMKVIIITDSYHETVIKLGLEFLGLEKDIPIILFPFDGRFDDPARHSNEKKFSKNSIDWASNFFTNDIGRKVSHLIAIERVGPNHTIESIMKHNDFSNSIINKFESIVPKDKRNKCLNFRLKDITPFTAKTHLLFEEIIDKKLPITTLGIGDQGNELGMGKINWENFLKADNNRRALSACRISTDYLIPCGISNWGGYALLAAVSQFLDKSHIFKKISFKEEKNILEYIVNKGPAVDGITGKQSLSVDGLAFEKYFEPIKELQKLFS